MPVEYLPPKEFLVQCFDYAPETGLFVWKTRPAAHFNDRANWLMWNNQNAGRPAFVGVARGYARTEIRYDGRRVRANAHRVAFKIVHEWEPEQVDHIDGNRLNNAIANLRAATQAQNQANRAGWGGRDLPKGVYRDGGSLRAAVWIGGRSVKLGRFADPATAHEAYCRAAQEHHGEFFHPGLVFG